MSLRHKAVLDQSSYMMGLQCLKNFYLQKKHSDLKKKFSASKHIMFTAGDDLVGIAHTLFPAGVNAARDVSKTAELISDGASVIYNAAFKTEIMSGWVDLICRIEDGWEIIRIKSASGVKEVIANELFYQYYLLKSAGINILSVRLLHLNNKYVRQGDIEPSKLFRSADLMEVVEEKEEFVAAKVKQMCQILEEGLPEVEVGRHCFAPRLCGFKDFCWDPPVPENSVLTLRGRGANKYELYNKGIIEFKDLPLEKLSGKQKFQAVATINQENFVKINKVREFISTLWYPLYFLDLETMTYAIPPYNGVRPFQQIPFQYSLHYLETEDSQLQHSECIIEPGGDPRRSVAERLIDEIDPAACVLVYAKSFEERMLHDLGDEFSEFKVKFSQIIMNMRDLADPFRNRDIYYWKMNGSYSLKSVLPALVEGLSYDGMEIGNGKMAVDAYTRLENCNDPAEKNHIIQSLLEYCKLDTLALVKILEEIRKL